MPSQKQPPKPEKHPVEMTSEEIAAHVFPKDVHDRLKEIAKNPPEKPPKTAKSST